MDSEFSSFNELESSVQQYEEHNLVKFLYNYSMVRVAM